MIAIVRMKAQERRDQLWDYVVDHAGDLQKRLESEGRLLFLSQRARHEDISLFVHVADPDVLAGLIARMVLLPVGPLNDAPLAFRIVGIAVGLAAFFLLGRRLLVAVGLGLLVFTALVAAV